MKLLVFCVVLLRCQSSFAGKNDDLLLDSPTKSRLPFFVKEPKDAYVVKNKPAVLICEAGNALKLHFECNDETVESKEYITQAYTDPMSGIRRIEKRVNITRKDVEEYFGGFGCRCFAWSSYGIRKSARAEVKVAYLKKRFDNNPFNSVVQLEGQLALSCLPPEGVPPPKVFWMKNGKDLDTEKDVNLIISNEGNLIISQARLSDMGNYTCGAQNLASRRLGSTASLIVYVHGQWSSWSPWSDCSENCGRGTKRRSRSCTNPAPLNGGETCVGRATQSSVCHNMCKAINGAWTSWSSWSTCGPDCKHHRRRKCSNPKPKNGGQYCPGLDLASSICSGGMCRAEGGWNTWSSWSVCGPDCRKSRQRKCINPRKQNYCRGPKQIVINCTNELCILNVNGYHDDQNSIEPEADKEGVVQARMKKDVILYIGLIITVTVFIAAIVVVILLVRKKQQDHSMYEDPISSLRDVRTMEPDLTQSVPNNLEIDSPSDVGGQGNKRNIFMGFRNSHNYASVPDDSIAPNIGFIRTSQMNNYNNNHCNSTRHSFSCASDSSDSGVSSSDSQPSSIKIIPPHIDPECMAWADVTHTGAHLSVPRSGTSLTIPPGAIKKGTTERIYVAVLRDDIDRPHLPDNSTMLGPVVLCGPPNITFKKDVVLGFEHCCRMKQSDWVISLYNTEDDNGVPHPKWKRALTVGEESVRSNVCCHIDASHCYIMTSKLSRFALIGQSYASTKAIKTLKLLAFGPMVKVTPNYSIRLYCVQDTCDSVQGVLKLEEKLGGKMLDEPKSLNFVDDGSALCAHLTDLCDGWGISISHDTQEVPFGKIWSGSQNFLHCLFSVDHIDRSLQTISAKLTVNQKGQRTCRQVFNINTCLNEKSTFSTFIPQQTQPTIVCKAVQNKNKGHNPKVKLNNQVESFRMSRGVRKKLCHCLDQPDSKGHDWRELLKELGIDRQMSYFSRKQSPTELILDLWEARHREPLALADLANILHVIGRGDAASIIEKQIGPWI